jgi:hypothetical protein
MGWNCPDTEKKKVLQSITKIHSFIYSCRIFISLVLD